MLPCACEVYAGDCRLDMAVAVAVSSAMRKSSLFDCMTALLSTACVLPHSTGIVEDMLTDIACFAFCLLFVLPYTCLFQHLWL